MPQNTRPGRGAAVLACTLLLVAACGEPLPKHALRLDPATAVATARATSAGDAAAFERDHARGEFVHSAGRDVRVAVREADGEISVRSDDCAVTLTPAMRPSRATAWDGAAVFEDAEATVVLTATSHGIKEDLVFARSAGERFERTWRLSLTGCARATLTADGAVVVDGADGRRRFTLPAPFVLDAQGTRFDEGIRYTLDGDELRLTAERTSRFAPPYSIDPTVVATTTAELAQGNFESDTVISVDEVQRATGTLALAAWTATTALPTATDKAASVAHSGFLYMSGGRTGTALIDTVRFAAITGGAVGAWSTSSAFTTARHSHGAAAYNGHLYIVGGSDGTTALADVQVARLDPSGTVGTFAATTPLPSARRSMAVAATGGYLYVLGGTATSKLADVLVAPIKGDGTLGAWTAQASLPSARDDFEVVAHGRRLYAVGGALGTASTSEVLVAQVNLDGTLGAWTATTPLRDVRSRHAAVAARGHLYVLGGWDGDATQINYSSVFAAPILPSGAIGRWRLVNQLPSARRNLDAAVWGDAILSAGGFDTTYTDSVAGAVAGAAGSAGDWRTTTALPTARQFVGTAVWNGFVYAAGGCVNDDVNCGAGNVLSEVRFAKINADGTFGAWTSTTSFTTPRWGHAVVAANGFLYVIGGKDAAGTLLADIQYAVITPNGTLGTFTTSNRKLPSGLFRHQAVVVDNTLYIVGGFNGAAGAAGFVADVLYSDLLANGNLAAPLATTSALLTGRRSHSLLAHGKHLYVLGGSDNAGDLSSVELAPVNSNGTLGAWTTTTALPAARRSLAVASHDGRAYAIEGFDGTFANTSWFASFNANGTIGSWSTLSAVPLARAAHASFALNGVLYVLGGDTGVSFTADVSMVLLSVAGNIRAWTASSPLGTAVSGHGAAVIDGYAYVTGGYTGTKSIDTVQYAPVNTDGTLGTFGTTTALPAVRNGHATVATSEHLYVIGGWDGVKRNATVYVAPLSATGGLGSWSTTTALPSPRSNIRAVIHGGRIYVAGGWDGTIRFDDVLVAPINADGTLGTWSVAGTFATGRSQHGVAINDGRFYVFGGLNGAVTPSYFSDIQVATIGSSGALGAFTTLSARLPQRIRAFGAASSDGYLYVTGGDLDVALTSTVWSAPFLSTGELGGFSELSQLSDREDLLTVFARERLYVFGGGTYSGMLTDTFVAEVEAPPAVGEYSRLFDLGAEAAVDSITIGGSTAKNGQVRYSVRTAPSSGVFGAWPATADASLGQAITIGATNARYVHVAVRLADRGTATRGGPQREVTDITVAYTSAATQIVFASAAQPVAAGGCSAALVVESRGSSNATAPVTSPTTVNLASSSAAMVFYSDSTCTSAVTAVTLAAGASSATFYFSDTTAGTPTVTASTSTLGMATQVQTVSAEVPAALAFTTAPQTVTAGACSGVATVEARDAFGNPAAPSAAATVTLTSTSSTLELFASAGCLGSVTSVQLAAGSTSQSFFFRDTAAGTHTVTATSSFGAVSQTAIVTPDAASSLSVAGFPSPRSVGVPGAFVVTAQDGFGNTATSFAGLVTFSATDAQAQLPAPFSFGPTEQGTRTFSATFFTVGTQMLTATGPGGLVGTHTPIEVVPGPAIAFELAGISTPVLAGSKQSLTVLARDAAGNIAVGYQGTVRFTSDDAAAVLPGDYTFLPADNGVHTFGVELHTPGTRTVTAADLSNAALMGTHAPVVVLQTQGGTCTADSDCGTGFCEQGICCATACVGVCVACNVAGQAGTCSPVPDGLTCEDTTYCNGVETCQAGVCALGASVSCVDPEGERALTCDESARACVEVPDSPPVITEDAVLTAAVGLKWPYNAAGRIKAVGAQPMTYSSCAGPGNLKVEAATGVVSWTPDAAGDVPICVRAQNAFGMDSWSFVVSVGAAQGSGPTASFVVVPPEGKAPLASLFDGAASTADPATPLVAWRWDFGDFAPLGFGAVVTHNYLVPGGYQAHLEVVDAVGRTDRAARPVSVRDAQNRRPPAARLLASATAGTGSLEVAFSCTPCEPGDAPITAYRWDFEAGAASDEAAPRHTFGPGRYRVHLTVVDANGNVARDAAEIVVKDGELLPPGCRLSLLPPGGPAPTLIEHCADFADEDGQVVTHTVRFPDGSSSSLLCTGRAFSEAGRHEATLVVTDDAGLSCHDRVEAVVLAADGSVPPRILSLPSMVARCGVPWTYSERGDGLPKAAGTGPLRWSAEPDPAAPLEGVEVDPLTGAVRWTPSSAGTGTATFILRVDGAGGSDTQRVEVDVACGAPLALGVGCGCGAQGASAASLPLLLAIAWLFNERRRLRRVTSRPG